MKNNSANHRKSITGRSLLFGTIGIFLAVLLIAACKPKNEEVAIAEPSPCTTCGPDYFSMQPMPTSANYPVPDSVIQQWIKTRDGHATRTHAWNLFAGLMGEASGNNNQQVWLWRTWPTATQAYDTGAPREYCVIDSTNKNSKPNNLKLVNQTNYVDSILLPAPSYKVPEAACDILCNLDPPYPECTVPINGCQFQNNGDVMIAGVIYNKPAYDHIRNNGIYSWDTLVAMLSKNYMNPNWEDRRIPEFPSDAIVLKPMLWPVKQKGYTPLPVFPLQCYDRNANCDIVNDTLKYSGFEEQRVWNSAVAISANPAEKGTTLNSLDFLYGVYKTEAQKKEIGPNTYENVVVHGLDEFYHWQVTPEEWDALECVDKAIITQSSYWAYNEPFEPGDYLALVAMHVITKEAHDWTFQSFWWDGTPKGQSSKFVQMRDNVTNPPDPSAFNNYLMTSTYGMNDKHSNQNEWPVAFNPYIELAAAHPINTNCMNCHKRGAFPNKTDLASLKLDLQNYASYLNPNFARPTRLDTFDFNNAVMDSLLITDFQWAIPDRVEPPKKKE